VKDKVEKFDKFIDDINNQTPFQKNVDNIIWWVRHGIWQKISNIPFRTKMNYQRIKRGYSDEDCWGLCYFHSDIMSKAVRQMQEIAHGYPSCLIKNHRSDFVYNKSEEDEAFEEWKEILGKIANTFEIAKKVQDSKLYLISSEEYTDEWFKERTDMGIRMGKEYNEWFSRPLTLDEIKKYEEGWKLFSEFYFNLWD